MQENGLVSIIKHMLDSRSFGAVTFCIEIRGVRVPIFLQQSKVLLEKWTELKSIHKKILSKYVSTYV